MYVSRRLSKRELDKVVVRVLGVGNIRKHNTLLLALLADVSASRAKGRNAIAGVAPRDRGQRQEFRGRVGAPWRTTSVATQDSRDNGSRSGCCGPTRRTTRATTSSGLCDVRPCHRGVALDWCSGEWRKTGLTAPASLPHAKIDRRLPRNNRGCAERIVVGGLAVAASSPMLDSTARASSRSRWTISLS